MRPIIWLASYPRSGNTYLRALIGNYLHSRGEPLPLNSLSQITSGEHKEEFWRELTGKPAAERTLDEEWDARPRYLRLLRALPGEGPLLIKTHTINGAYKGASAFGFERGDRVIFLARHPGDVAVSAADFYGIDLDESIDRLIRPGLFIDGRPDTGFEVLGSWAQHTRSWLDEQRIPVLCLQYGDLVGAPEDQLRLIIPFIGVKPDPAQIAQAVAFARFDRLRAQEERAGFNESSPHSKSGRFFRAGRTLQWRDTLSPQQAERLLAPNQPLLDQMGFVEMAKTCPT